MKKAGELLLVLTLLFAGVIVPVQTQATKADSRIARTESETLTGTSEEEENRDGEEKTDGEENTDGETGDDDTLPELEIPILNTVSKPNGSIKIRWQEITGAEKYKLYRSTKKDSGFHKIFETKAGTHSYEDKGRRIGKPYYYQLEAVPDETKAAVKSKKAAGRILKQAEITEISNISGSKKLVLHWKAVKGAKSYQIMRKKADGEYKIVGTVKNTKTVFTDKDRTGGVTYTYRVCATDENGGRGKYSESKSQIAIDKKKK